MNRVRDLWPLAVLLLFHRSARALVIPRSVPAGLLVVNKVHTGGPTWKADRFAALANAGITGDVARAIVAHWAFETGWGSGEWNYNVGNRIALPGEQAVDVGVQWSKAYPLLSQGVADYLALLQGQPRYALAWQSLQTAPRSTTWIRQFVQAGYATLDPATYEARYAATLKMLGD